MKTINVRTRRNIVSMTITLIVVALLIISGPISAVRVGVGTAPASVEETNIVTFTTYVSFETDERIPIQDITVDINASSTVRTAYCVFNTAGNAISGDCTGDSMNITRVSNSYSLEHGYGYGYSSDRFGYDYTTGSDTYGTKYSFGYGYGYGYDTVNTIGTLNYTITWVTPSVSANTNYDVHTKVNTGSTVFDYLAEDYLTVTNAVTGGGDTGGGGSSGAVVTTTEDETVPETQDYVVYDTPEEITDTTQKSALADEFGDLGEGFEGVGAEDLEITKTDTITITEKLSATLEDVLSVIDDILATLVVDDQAKTLIEQLKDLLTGGETEKIALVKTVENYEITNPETGATAQRSRISLVIEATNEDRTDVNIIEVISKTIAETASEVDFAISPTVLQEDPIVQWKFDTIPKGTSEDLSYIVNKKVTLEDIQASKTVTGAVVASSATSAHDTTDTSDVDTVDPIVDDLEDFPTTHTEDNDGESKTWLWVLIILLAVGVVVYYLVSVGKIDMKKTATTKE